MLDFNSLVTELLGAIGDAPEADHGPGNCRAEVERVLYMLRDSPFVDQSSLLGKLCEVVKIKGDGGATRGQIARMLDRFAEFRAAEHLLKLATPGDAAGLVIAFSEAPDIHVNVVNKGLNFGLEVKRPRLRAQDHTDEARLREALREGRLAVYGDPC